MAATVVIRMEGIGDAPVIAGIVERAFADVPYSDHREQAMVDRLRRTDAFVPALSLLAEVHRQPAGHILLTRATIRNQRTTSETLALAPLSVLPEHQRRGVGRSLIQAAHAQATALGFGSIVLLGGPGYYRRFGYEPLSRYPITLPFPVPTENCMVLPLRPGALAGVSGVVEYAVDWLEH